MTLTIRDHTTGEAIRSWNQPGKRKNVIAMAMKYATGAKDTVIAGKGRVEVWVVR